MVENMRDTFCDLPEIVTINIVNFEQIYNMILSISHIRTRFTEYQKKDKRSYIKNSKIGNVVNPTDSENIRLPNKFGPRRSKVDNAP
jgi:hypothetical protein